MCSYCPFPPFITRRVFYSSHTPLMFTNDSSLLFTNDQPIIYQRLQPIVYQRPAYCLPTTPADCLPTITMSTWPIVYESAVSQLLPPVQKNWGRGRPKTDFSKIQEKNSFYPQNFLRSFFVIKSFEV